MYESEYPPTVPFSEIHGSLPGDVAPDQFDPQKITNTVFEFFKNPEIACLTDDAIWRDWLCLSGSARTFNGAAIFVEFFEIGKAMSFPSDLSFTTPPSRGKAGLDSSWISTEFTFKTHQSNGLVGRSRGVAFLVPASIGSKEWKIWVLATALESFEGYGHPDQPRMDLDLPPRDVQDGKNSRLDVPVVVVGAGQAGLGLAGRLAALGIEYILLEREADVGFAWWGRYDTITLHTWRDLSNLPFDFTWDENDPELLTGRRVYEGFRRYVERYKINVWRKSSIESCRWDEKVRMWELCICTGGSVRRMVRSHHLCLTMGPSLSVYRDPQIPGKFEGLLVEHPDFKNSRAWRGKRGVVIGSGNTGHDIADDMCVHGLSSVTMIQRDKTAVFPKEWVTYPASSIYNRKKDTAELDLSKMIIPEKIGREITARGIAARREQSEPLFRGLEQAGFKVDKEPQLIDLIWGRGGYYIDIGTSQRIIDGDIKIQRGNIKRFVKEGLEMEDGRKIAADVIVIATGFELDSTSQTASVVGWDIAQKCDTVWGLDKEGDMRGLLTPHYCGALWISGGGIARARFNSRFIALQILEDLLERGLHGRIPLRANI